MEALQLTFGSDPNRVNIYIHDPEVSALHMAAFCVQGKIYVRDLGSMNGVYINNKRITYQVARLFPGDIVTIGRTRIPYGKHTLASS